MSYFNCCTILKFTCKHTDWKYAQRLTLFQIFVTRWWRKYLVRVLVYNILRSLLVNFLSYMLTECREFQGLSKKNGLCRRLSYRGIFNLNEEKSGTRAVRIINVLFRLVKRFKLWILLWLCHIRLFDDFSSGWHTQFCCCTSCWVAIGYLLIRFTSCMTSLAFYTDTWLWALL